MKLKYFLRGLGMGIIFTSIILIISFRTVSNNNLSDAEIITKAKSLGMQMPKQGEDLDLKELLENDDPQKTNEVNEEKENSKSPDSIKTTDKPNTIDAEVEADNPSTIDTQVEADKPTTSHTKEEADNPTTLDTEAVSESKENVHPKDDKIANQSDEYVNIKIDLGMWSNQVADMLMEKKLIKNSKDFINYLIENDYQSKLIPGKYKIKRDSSYKEIVEKIAR